MKRDIDGPYLAIHNKSSKDILAYLGVTKVIDEGGKTQPCESRADYAFKSSVLGTPTRKRAGGQARRVSCGLACY